MGDDVLHEGGLAHAGACHVEVVPSEQVVGEADAAGWVGGRVADMRADGEFAAGGGEHAGTRPFDGRRLVTSRGGMPECGDLPDAEDSAPAEEAGSRGGEFDGLRLGPDFASDEPSAGGIVVVPIGRCGFS